MAATTSSCFHITEVEEIKRIVGEGLYEREIIGPDGQSPVSGGSSLTGAARTLVITNSLSAGVGNDQPTNNASVYGHGAGAIRMLAASLRGALVFDDVGNTINVNGSGKDLVGGFFCFGGATSTTILNNLQYCLTAYKPKIVIGRLFENDVGGIPLAESYASLVKFVSEVKAAGALPIVMTCLPRPFFTTNAHRVHFDYLWDACYEYCAANGAVCLDSSTQYIDHSSAYPIPLSGYADTGVGGGHPYQRANALLADAWYAQLAPLFLSAARDIPGKISGNAMLSVVANPTMVGTAGTPSGVSDTWTQGGVATITQTPVASGPRTVPKYGINWAGVAGASQALWTLRQPTASTGFSVGDTVYFEVDCEFANAVNIKTLSVYLDVGGKLVMANWMDSTQAGWGAKQPAGRYVFRTPAYTIPSGVTTVRAWMYLYSENNTASAGCDLTIHSAVARKWPGVVA